MTETFAHHILKAQAIHNQTRGQRDDCTATLIATALFLERLAEHLEAAEMPGQAGNCIIRAKECRDVVARTEGPRHGQ